MAKIYLRLVLSRERTLEQVPEHWRQEVAALLIA